MGMSINAAVRRKTVAYQHRDYLRLKGSVRGVIKAKKLMKNGSSLVIEPLHNNFRQDQSWFWARVRTSVKVRAEVVSV